MQSTLRFNNLFSSFSGPDCRLAASASCITWHGDEGVARIFLVGVLSSPKGARSISPMKVAFGTYWSHDYLFYQWKEGGSRALRAWQSALVISGLKLKFKELFCQGKLNEIILRVILQSNERRRKHTRMKKPSPGTTTLPWVKKMIVGGLSLQACICLSNPGFLCRVSVTKNMQ